jgi:hypothetical protein
MTVTAAWNNMSKPGLLHSLNGSNSIEEEFTGEIVELFVAGQVETTSCCFGKRTHGTQKIGVLARGYRFPPQKDSAVAACAGDLSLEDGATD